MKKFIIILMIFGAMTSIALKSQAQCEKEDFMDNCASLLDDYTFVKSFEVKTDKTKAKVEFSSVFSRDHNYVITVCSGDKTDGKKMIVNLYDRDRKLIASSFFKPKKLHVKKIGYQCTATGVYYIEATMEDGGAGCGVTILGFKK